MRTRILPLLLAGFLAAIDVQAASLRMSDGGTLSVGVLPVPVGADRLLSGQPQSLMFTVTERDGRTWAGAVPGSEGASPSDVTLAINPITSDVVMAFARPGRGGHDIVTTTWTGQDWSEPQELATGSADEHAPLLAFRPSGDALLAYVSEGPATSTILLRHFEPGSGDAPQTYSFVDAGSARQLAGDLALASGAEPTLLGVVGGVDALAAYLLIGAPDRTPMSVVRLGLDAILDAGGFGAAPVPVSFIRSATQSAGSGSQLTGRAGDAQGVGEILAPWRLVMGRGEAWYWADGDRAHLVTFTGADAIPGALMGFDLPATEALLHVEAYRIARSELGYAARRGAAELPVGLRRLR